jgi:integrative and conjugative element protein (TIGR02256 family)
VPQPLDGYSAWAHSHVVDLMIAEADRHYPLETGGLLIGYRAGPAAVVISHAIGPGDRAQHARRAFIPDHDWQTEELARVYEATGRRHTYLGDWHTHPDGPPWPSRVDRETLRRIAHHAEARCPQPIQAILGGFEPWNPAIFQLRRPGRPHLGVRRLRVISTH